LGKTFQIKFVESTRGIILRELGGSINLNAVRSNRLGATGSTSGLVENKFAAPAIQLGESAVLFNPTAKSSGLSDNSSGQSSGLSGLSVWSFGVSAKLSCLSCCSYIYTSNPFGLSIGAFGVAAESFGTAKTSYLLGFRLF